MNSSPDRVAEPETHARVGRRMACGVRDGNCSVLLRLVSCRACLDVAQLADALAIVCGCRRPDVHLGVARAQHEIAEHRL